MRRRLPVALAAALLGGCAGVEPPEPAPVPVMVAQSGGELDDCPSNGVLIGQGARNAKAPVEVRSGPSARHALVTSAPTGVDVYLCDAREGWTGVVLRLEQPDDCGVGGGSGGGPRPYVGPCVSGWVRDRDVIATAG